MKKILLTMIAAVSAFAGQSQWINQNVPIPYFGYIKDMEVVDGNTAWGIIADSVTATNGYRKDFAHTIDGGTTWTFGTVTSGTEVLCNISAIDANTTYVATVSLTAGGGSIYKTTDGGATWNDVSDPGMFTQSTSFADVVYFWDANNGMAMGDPIGPVGSRKYEIWTTSNGGTSWTAVAAASLPVLTNQAEYGITNLFNASAGSIWFGTTYGDLYKSTDMGLTWTKSATGLPSTPTTAKQDINDIAFYDASNGLVVQSNGNTATYTLLKTTDGGATWSPVSPVGSFYPTEIEGVPGSTVIVSTGSTQAFGFGSSFSTDLGTTWNDLDANPSHTAVDFTNITTGFGGQVVDPTSGAGGGAWKFSGILAILACSDTLVSAGVSSLSDSLLCPDDTISFFTSGAFPPSSSTAAEAGFGVLLSSADISFSNDPLSTGLVINGTQALPSNTTITLNAFPVGDYYLTAIVFGNATGTAGNNLTTYVFDPACTHTGQSYKMTALAAGDPLCSVGFNNLNSSEFSISNLYPVPVRETLNFTLNSKNATDVNVSVKDVLGREVYKNTVHTTSGQNTVSIAMVKYTSGVYTISIANGKNISTSKFVKQ